MNGKKQDMILLGLLVLAIAVLGFTAWVALSNGSQTLKPSPTTQPNADDPCKAPAGYSQEDWNTHMSHHPDQYKQCLKK